MSKVAMAALLAVLAGCNQPVDYVKLAQDAEAQYRMAKEAGNEADLCELATAAKKAWLTAKDSGKYSHWSTMATL